MMNLRIGLYCLLGGISLTIAALGAHHFAWWWLSGILLAAAFVPVARFGPPRTLAQFGAILLVLVIAGSVCTGWEAVIFLPGQKETAGSNLLGSIVMYLILAAVLALLAKFLRLTKAASTSTVERRPVATTAVMVGLSGIAYVVYYQIFGSITYQFFTRQYYPQAEKIVLGLGLWFWVIELARGILMTLAVLPIINTLRMRRWPTAFAVGALLWIVGGPAQLLVPNALMTATQRWIHIVEILTQNALLGITAALLLRPKPAATITALHAATSP